MDQSRLITLGWGVEGSYIGRLHLFSGETEGGISRRQQCLQGGGTIEEM